jgi:hypothetical protein
MATARWRALDREGQETCRLSRSEDGWLLVGHAQFRDDLGVASLNYIVRCDLAWMTQSADLAGRHDDREVSVRVHVENGTWWVGETKQDQVEGASDIDLSFTPATNLMPLRRLAETRAPELATTAAWLRYPSAKLERLDQTYRRTQNADFVRYSAKQTGYATDLRVDQSGFVTHYPDGWEGEVQHES